MGRVKVMGFMLVVALAVSAMASTTASALQWLLNGTPLTSAVSVTSKSTLELSDLAASGGAVAVVCEGTDKGTVGPGDRDEVTEITESECEFHEGEDGACEASKEVKAGALNLPWLSLVLDVELLTVDKITAEGGKGPGWSVTCTVAGIIKVADECTSSSIQAEVENETPGVNLLFTGETASCSVGSKTSGMVLGTDLIEDPTGKSLEVQVIPTSHLEFASRANPFQVSTTLGFTTTVEYRQAPFGPANTGVLHLFFNRAFANNRSSCEDSRGLSNGQTCTVSISCRTANERGIVFVRPTTGVVAAERALVCEVRA
jgi:hypothetical protein